MRRATLRNLPNNLDALRTGTACDGRALFFVGDVADPNRASALRDLQSRIPAGWTLEMHQSGVDVILTSDEAVRS